MADACILRPAVLRSWQPGVALGTHRAQESVWYVSNLIFTPCDLSWFQEMDLSTASTREHLPHCCFMAPEASMGQTVLPHRAEVGWAAHDQRPAMGAGSGPLCLLAVRILGQQEQEGVSWGSRGGGSRDWQGHLAGSGRSGAWEVRHCSCWVSGMCVPPGRLLPSLWNFQVVLSTNDPGMASVSATVPYSVQIGS